MKATGGRMNQHIRITVPLSPDEFEKLKDVAMAERRHPREQAAYMLRKILFSSRRQNKSDVTSLDSWVNVASLTGNPS